MKESQKLQANNQSKTNIFVKIFRFFFPKNFKAEMLRGRMIGSDIKSNPLWWLGKGARKIVDPKHKMKFK